MKSFPHRRFNHAEQLNKLHPFVWRWMSKIVGATVVGQGIRKCTYDQSALIISDHDLVFVVDRHTQSRHEVFSTALIQIKRPRSVAACYAPLQQPVHFVGGIGAGGP